MMIERLEQRALLATLYWDPDRIATNNVIKTGAGLGGSGNWSEAGAAVWFNPALNGTAGGYVSWNSSAGDTAVFTGPSGGTVTISGTVGATGVEFRTAGFVVSGGSFTTAAAGTTFTATAAGRFDSPLVGAGGITKAGAAMLTLGAALNTYSGDTRLTAGMLDVRGTIQSHVRPLGGSVQGVMFYDPDLAAAVREALGVDQNTWLTSAALGQSSPLASLTVNGSLVGDLTGIANLSALRTLAFIPGDYSATPQGLSSLAPLAGLANLAELSLHDIGLTDAVLATLPALPGLTRLDVRSNALSAVPAGVANLPRLATLFVHGNPLLADNPRAGLSSLKGKAIDVDVAPDRPETAASIADLAARLYFLPLKMLDYVTNTVVYQAYAGAMKGPLATLQTKAGNDWDTNSLLAALYGAAGISTRYVAGAIEVTESQLRDYVGARDTFAAANILAAAGLGYDQYANRFKHIWIEALVSVPATGVQAWVPIDASWKLRDFRPGLSGILTSVPFSPLETDYLTNPVWQKKSTAEYYEAKVATWLAQNRPEFTIADVGYDGPIRQQSFPVLPTGLPYAVVSQPAESARPTAIPAASQYRVTIRLANGTKALFGASGVNLTLADVALSRLTIDPQFNVKGTARPVLRRDGVAVTTTPTAIANAAARQLTLTITVTAPAGGTGYSRTFTRAADRFIAIGLDANQFSESFLATKRGIANAQQLNRANGVAVDRDQAVGGLLDLAIAQYFTAADADEASLASLTSAVADRTNVALGIATSGPALSTTATSGLQFPYLPADMGIDVPANVNGGFAIDASTTAIDLNRNLLLGYTNSALEGLTLEELTNFESVSTMKAFQIAATAAGGMSNLVEINAGNVANISTLLPGVRPEIRNAIAATVTNGLSGVADYAGVKFTALVPKNEVAVGSGTDTTKQWKGVGYTLKCVTSDPAKAALNGKTVGYIIHGAVGTNPLVSYGGAASRVSAPRPNLKATVAVYNPGLGAGDPVNMATGGVYHEETDVEIPNLGMPLAFRRRYDSIHTVSGLVGSPAAWSDRGMGEGWSFTYSDRIEVGVDGASTVTWFTDTGMRLVFTGSTGGFTNPAGVFGSLTGSAAAGFTWKDFDGNTTVFGAAVGGFCPIASTSDRFGNGIAISYVAGTNRIARVSDRRDATRWLSFRYNADARPHITAVADFTGRTWTYSYATDGRLATVTAASPAAGVAGPVVRYAYHADAARRGLLASVTDPAGNVTAWEYYANRRGFRVTDAEGLRHSFTYNLYRKQSAFINERGDASRYSYDDQGNLLEVQQSDRTAERSTWLANGLKATSLDAYGATTAFAYDATTGKVTRMTDPLGNATTFDYFVGTFRDIAKITRLNRPNDASDDIATGFSYDASGFMTSKTDDVGFYGPFLEPQKQINATTRFTPAAGGRGLVQSTTSPRGVATTFTYNAAGQVLTQATDSSPGVTVTQSFAYDARGNLTARTDGNGNVTSFTFDALGRKTSETSPDPDGAGPLPAIVATYAYDVVGNLVSTTLGDGRITRSVSDKRQREVRRTAADGTFTLVSYDPAGNKATETDAQGRITRYVYDARNRLVAAISPDGTTTRLRLDGGGRIVATLDQAGATTTYAYDKLGRKTRETLSDPDGTGPLAAPSSAWGYDSRGNLQFVTPSFVGQSGITAGDAAWSTHYEYDALGRKTKQTQADPDGAGPLARPITTFSYDADGNLLAVTDPRGFTTTYAYDNLGRRITETSADPDGTGPLVALVRRSVYDRAGNLRFEVAPGGASEADVSFTTEHVYDALNREIRTILPDPDGPTGPLGRPTPTRAFNASGFLASTTDALGRTTSYAYDKLGRVLSVTNALGATATTAHDAVGNTVITTDALGRRTFTSYDSANRPVQVRSPRPDGTSATPVTTYAYDVTGNLVQSTDALGRTTWRQYDALGRLIAETSPLGLTSLTEYDLAGRVTATIDELGRRTDTVYDNLGRTIRVLSPDAGQGRPTTHSGYDAAGNLRFTTDPRGASAGDPGFTTYFFYDALGRRTATVDALGADWPVTAIPDLLPGTVTTNVTRTSYDARGRIASTTDALGQTTDYAYDNLGRRTSETAPDPDGAGPLTRPVTRYGYDAVGNRTSVTDPLGFVAAYAYDALDRRTTVTDARGFATVTTYDARGNTTSVTDASGNVTRYAYDRLNRLTSETDPLGAITTSAYDLAGNQTKETDRLGRVTTFVFDAADRLVEERWQPSATAAISHTIKRIYDAAGQLVGVTETDTMAFSTTAWQFTYDAAGNVVKSRMAPGEIDQQPIAWSGALAAGDSLIDWDGDGIGERYDVYSYSVAPGDVIDVTVTATAGTFTPALLLQRSSRPTELVWFEGSAGASQLVTSRTADTAETWYFAVTARNELAAGGYDIRIVKNTNSIVSTALVEYDFAYDKAGNLLSATEDQAAVGDMYGFGPAASGLGVRTSFTLDALNRVTRYEQAETATGQVTKRADYAYRGNGSVGTVTRFAGAGVNPIGTSTATYDALGRLTGITHAPSASPSIAYAYAYDAASRITSMTTPEGTSSFTLDATDQLLSASLTGEAYAYDKTGNRTNSGTQTGSGNRLAFDGTYRYAYDAEGNRTAKFLDTNAGGTLSAGDTDVTVYVSRRA
jgi:YD repeat-containing protein/autotransporter-associated beta strand protein